MNGAIQNFLSISLPIMFTLVGTSDEVDTRLGRIEHKLDNHEERLVRVEERTSMVRH
jgi:hypothetical protein